MTETLVIEHRFRGPAQSGNGGYTCGLVASLLDGAAAEVTLRLPPPLETPLRVERDAGAVRVLDGDALVAEARPAPLELEPPEPVAYEEAVGGVADPRHPFPECFVCGPGRVRGDALRLTPRPVGDDVVAAPWTPTSDLAGDARFVWAALDCPGAFAVDPGLERGVSVLGRLHAQVDATPEVGERCVVVAWPLDRGEGRKRLAGTALFGEGGRLLGIARATWILIEPRA